MESKGRKRSARRKHLSRKRMPRLSGTRWRKPSRPRANMATRRFRKASPAPLRSEHNLPRDTQNIETAGIEVCLQEELPTENGSFAAAAFEEGYRKGYYEGGEGRLCRQLPPYTVLPDLTVDDVIARGILQSASSLVPIMPPAAVYAEVVQALDQRLPLSVVRLGDGELLTLAHDMIISTDQARLWGTFLPYAGVILPDGAARGALAYSLRVASIVGIPESRHPSFQGLLFPVLKQLGISYHELKMTTSTINYALHEQGLFYPMLRGRKLLLIGNKADGLANVLSSQGFEVAGIITPVNGVHDVNRIMEEVAFLDFDLALVAAGVAAVMICTAIAEELGKVSFDLGHLANRLEDGEALLLPGLEVNG
ncbi:GT-D fold domain-containing protein [Paenibacillus bouchesdurhonensis]|uniref:GT-D fold domain-containing protein n=1 Tax=Paenibacillus bouchesdurhonensis TaxID=1870990 RepID=UPI001F1FA05D|nr:GT-D fold domain-containing glycosyltransferase [Paenibacillus bouchesdurhonensis]